MKGLLITQISLEGSAQMAADELMLEKSILSSGIDLLVRFYKWDKTYLSIGHNQRMLPERWIALHKENKLTIVRRPSGGNAVLHSGGLTYAMVWKGAPKKKHLAYSATNKWIISAFTELGITLQFGKERANHLSANCFASSTSADLIDDNGIKRVGSAQYWRQGNMLQHGEIVISPSKKLWLEVFQAPPPNPIEVSTKDEGLESLLINSLISNWEGIQLKKYSFNQNDLSKIKEFSKKYLFNTP